MPVAPGPRRQRRRQRRSYRHPPPWIARQRQPFMKSASIPNEVLLDSSTPRMIGPDGPVVEALTRSIVTTRPARRELERFSSSCRAREGSLGEPRDQSIESILYSQFCALELLRILRRLELISGLRTCSALYYSITVLRAPIQYRITVVLVARAHRLAAHHVRRQGKLFAHRSRICRSGGSAIAVMTQKQLIRRVKSRRPKLSAELRYMCTSPGSI